MAQEIERADSYRKNSQRCTGGEYPCIVCGKPIDPARATHMVHVHRGGGWAVTEEEAGKIDQSYDLGLHPIGSDCLRRHPELKPYAQTQHKE